MYPKRLTIWDSSKNQNDIEMPKNGKDNRYDRGKINFVLNSKMKETKEETKVQGIAPGSSHHIK